MITAFLDTILRYCIYSLLFELLFSLIIHRILSYSYYFLLLELLPNQIYSTSTNYEVMLGILN